MEKIHLLSFQHSCRDQYLNTNNPSDTARVNFGNLLGTENISGSKNLDITSHIFFIGGDPDLNDPNTAVQARNYLLGKNKVGQISQSLHLAIWPG